ncbi:purine phosphorylase [Methylothermus subterraneus]
MLGIVVALPDESLSLCPKRIPIGQSLALSPRIQVRVAGMGPSRAQAAAEDLYRAGARALLSWGCAAALESGLAAGTLLLPQGFVFPHGPISFLADLGWWSHLHRILAGVRPLVTAPLAGSDRVLATLAHKRALHKATGAAAADMESAFLAGWAAERRLPFLAVRAIADTATTPVPKAILTADDGRGGISLPKLGLGLLRQPRQIKEAIALGRKFRAAHARLAQAAQCLLPQGFGLPC